MFYIKIYRVSGTTRINPCVQVEDVRLSRKVLYHFAIFVIINEILIFEDWRKEACSAGPSANASARRDMLAPRLLACAELFTAAMAMLATHERSGVVHTFSFFYMSFCFVKLLFGTRKIIMR